MMSIRKETENVYPRNLHSLHGIQCDCGFVKMISEEWDELLRQQDEEATFADKYAQELEMMDEMETGKTYQKNIVEL